jgi:predicted HTH transcriptional regulator
VTCEFVKKTGECTQERHFCNRIPPKHFEEPLKILKTRVKKFANQRLLNHIDVKKVKVKINGKEVEPEPRTAFDELLLNAINGVEF